MPNAITPVQSTKPTMREWMLSRLFSDKGLSQEFYNRLMNLCNYDYPMSPSLRGLVESKFGFEMLHTIEQYKDLEKPVLTSALRGSIRRVIPDEYYLEFLRLFDCSCCPLIIQEVNDIANAVDGTAVGQLTIVRYIDAESIQHINLYEWDGVGWIFMIDSSAKPVAGEFPDYSFSLVSGLWQFSVDGGTTWLGTSYTFPSPVASFSILFKNLSTNCIYGGGALEMPLPITYCVDVYEVDITDPLFFFGTINGIQADDAPNVQSTYDNWQGNNTSRTFLNFNTNPAHVVIFRDSSSPAFTNFGTYIPYGASEPQEWQPATSSNCVTNCYRAIFTVDDLSTDGNSSLTVHGTDTFDIDTGFFTPFSDPNAASNDLDLLILNNILEPTATMEYSFNGLEVTITICSIQEINGGAWSTAIGIETPFTYTQI